MKSDRHTIDNVASVVFDNGRRGAPRSGCDCIQCFGYCHVNHDDAIRHALTHREALRRLPDDFPAVLATFSRREE